MNNRNGAKGSKQHNRYLAARGINIRKSNVDLYRGIMITAVVCIGLALNFYLTTPTFQPYDIPNEVIGSIFLVFGISKIVFLNFYRNLLLVRLTVASSSGFMLFWGITNMQQGLLGKASFQLPIFVIGFALLQLKQLLEPSINPMSINRKDLNDRL